jgi:hypothetical protein
MVKMPLEDLFDDDSQRADADQTARRLYECYGVLANPFPSSAQTSGHPHRPTAADQMVDREIKEFIRSSNSSALAVTSSQGIGKTNLLNAYEKALREKLKGRGFFIIRYVADPEPLFDTLIRSIFEHLGEEHLKKIIEAAEGLKEAPLKAMLEELRAPDIQRAVYALIKIKKEGDQDNFDEAIQLAYQWLIGLPVRKAHKETLDVNFRLDTVESKTRALRDVVYLSAELEELRGVFILLDELEKQDLSLSKALVLRYLAALRALIDALPQHLFLMVALTTDALQRYREMLPALRGRLANEVRLNPIRDSKEAVEYWKFYLEEARKSAEPNAKAREWRQGSHDMLTEKDVEHLYEDLKKKSSTEGVRQRDFLNSLNGMASQKINDIGRSK